MIFGVSWILVGSKNRAKIDQKMDFPFLSLLGIRNVNGFSLCYVCCSYVVSRMVEREVTMYS